MWSRRWLNFIVALVGVVTLTGVTLTGIVIRWVIPHGGFRHRHGWGRYAGEDLHRARELLGLHRHEWGDIHTVFAILFVSLMVLHVILHWRWIVAVCRSLWGAPHATHAA